MSKGDDHIIDYILRDKEGYNLLMNFLSQRDLEIAFEQVTRFLFYEYTIYGKEITLEVFQNTFNIYLNVISRL